MGFTLARWSNLLIAVTLISTAFAIPSPNHGRARFSTFSHKNVESVMDDECTEPVQRKEWRQLTDHERQDYIKAVKCLHTLPARMTDMVPGALTRYEDFIGIHKIMTPQVKLTGQFMPWHRYFVALYEKALREECNYGGGQPYWDYSLDVAPGVDLLGSPIFSPTTGFGGDGNPGNDHCVCSGSPFSHWTIHVEGSRGLERNDHCLSRKLNPMIGYQWLRRGRGSIDEILGQPDFGSMWKLLEAEPSFENFIIGGSASDVFSSNAEPLFYLHHANLDRIWWQWQVANGTDSAEVSSRLFDISGEIAPSHDVFLPTPPPAFREGSVTLDFQLYVGRLGRVAEVWEVMDIGGSGPGPGHGTQSRKFGMLCYEYL